MKRFSLKTCNDLRDIVLALGFIPLFQNEAEGFSVMDGTGFRRWWTGDEETDPWMWRMILSGDPNIAYGKLFRNRAGFISKEWFPYFASFRRDGYDFDARYEDGKASHKSKKIMDLFEGMPSIPSFLIKSMAGFSRSGEKGFEGAITLLQMQTYITVTGFTRKQSKTGDYYGWHISVYSTSEQKFGYDRMTRAYAMGPEAAMDTVVRQMIKINPGMDREEAVRFLA